MALLEYKGYLGSLEYDDTVEQFHGRVVNIPDMITFEGRSVSELKRALRDSVEEYIAFCKKERVEPQQPFSGKLVVRLDPELHREAAVVAGREGLSLNKLIVRAVQRHVRELARSA